MASGTAGGAAGVAGGVAGGRDPVREAAERTPDALALDSGEERLSWAELDARVDRTASALAVAGVRPGAVVALLLPPGGAAVETLHALVRLGATAAPLNPRWTAAEAAAALERAGPDLLVCDAGTRERAGKVARGAGEARRAAGARLGGDAAPAVPVLGLPPAGEALQPRSAGGRFPGLREDAPLALIRTSGTAGDSRVVTLTLANLLAVARGSRERLGLGADDRWYGVLSPAHVGGLALIVRAAALGSAVVARPAFDPAEFLALSGDGRITHASLVPTMLPRILDEGGGAPAPEALRCLLVGGARTPEGLLERALGGGWPVALTYGLTEASSQVATAPPALVREKPGTAGPPLAGVEVRISEGGEVLVRGPTVARPGRGGPAVDEEGWLHTGDLGRLDGDGHLWITGRRSDRIVSGGVTVDPAEVEAALRLHEGVAEAAVVGIADREWGEVVVAAVVAGAGSGLDPEGLERHARSRLSGARIPRRIRVVEEIPRNANGKVDREGVAALFR